MNKKMFRAARFPLALMMLAIGLVLFPVAANAAPVPEKSGQIIDQAQLYSPSELAEVQKAIDGASFSFYLVTLESLEGEPIDSFAKATFEAWSLEPEDALMVVALEEREVYIEVLIGGIADRAIMQDPELKGGNPHSLLLDYYFSPNAASGDFVKAVTSVIAKLEKSIAEMKSNAGQAPSPGGGSAGSQSPAPGQDAASGKTPAQSGESASGSGRSAAGGGPNLLAEFGRAVRNIVVFLIAAYAAVKILKLVFRIWKSRRELASKWKNLQETHQSTLGVMHKLDQELPASAELAKGESAKLLHKLRERHYDLLQETSAFAEKLSAFKPPLWVKEAHRAALRELEEKTEKLASDVNELAEAAERYQKVERESRNRLEQAQQKWEEASAKLKRHIEATGYPSDLLARSCRTLEDELTRCRDVVAFDPVAIGPLVENLPERIDALIREIERVRQTAAKFAELPGRLQALREKLDRTIAEERLICAEISPYAFFERTNEQMARIRAALEKGDSDESSSVLSLIQSWMDDAEAQVARAVQTRDRNKEAVEDIKRRRARFDSPFIALLREKLQELQAEYDTVHWDEIPGQIRQIVETAEMIDRELPEAEKNNSFDTQHYFLAEQTLQRLQTSLAEIEEYARSIMNARAELGAARERLASAHAECARRLAECEDDMTRHGMHNDGRLHGMLQDVQFRLENVSSALQRVPRNIALIEVEIQVAGDVLNQLREALDHEIRVKQDAERRIQALDHMFNTNYSRYRSHIRQSYYKQEYRNISNAMQNALHMRDFPYLLSLIGHGERLIQEMRQEYEQQRRLAEMERQMRRQMRNMYPTGGSSWSSESGSSCHDSGSGSGSSRGGGSSWSGGSGSSSRSGGSGWSSSSGSSRGGGSSWGGSGGGSKGGGSSFGGGSRGGSRGGGSKW